MQGLRQLPRHLVGKLPHRDAPSTQNPVTSLSMENVHVTQCSWAGQGAAVVVAGVAVVASVVDAGTTWVVKAAVPPVVGPDIVDSVEATALVVEAAVKGVDALAVVVPVAVVAAVVVSGAAVAGTVAAAVLAVVPAVVLVVAVAVAVAAAVAAAVADEQFDHTDSVDPGAHEQSAASADAVKLTVKVTPPSTPTADTAEMTKPVRATLPLYCRVLGCPVLPTRGRSAPKQSPESPLVTRKRRHGLFNESSGAP